MPQHYLSCLPVAICALSSQGSIVFANNAAEHLLGEGIALLHHRPLTDYLHANAVLEELIHRCKTEHNLIRAYDISIESTRTGKHRANIQLCWMEDRQQLLLIIDTLQSEESLTHHLAHQDSLKGAACMAAILAHEIKNPLSGIRGAAQLLQKTVSDEDTMLTTLIIRESDRITSIMQEMEQLATPTQGNVQLVNIHTALREACARITEQCDDARCTLLEDYDPSLPEVHGNLTLLVQLFYNLLMNAIEAYATVPPPHTVKLSTRYQSGMRIHAGYTPHRRHDACLVVKIEDTAGGIPESIRSNLFTPFISSKLQKEKKTKRGLGLAIVNKIVSDHQGIIDVHHTPQGTCFAVTLPLKRPLKAA